jgi:PPOX class probable F420-dependent enzyme
MVTDMHPLTMDSGLARLSELAAQDRHLGVLITTGDDGAPQVSVVNCGIVDDPTTGWPRVALVARPGAKTRNLRRRPTATLVVRAGWEWIAVSGATTTIGPGDIAQHQIAPSEFTRLLRDIFHAAGGQHDDLTVYDAVMASERRCAVLIRPDRFTTNPPGSEHKETSA